MIIDSTRKKKIYCQQCRKDITDKEQYYEPDIYFIKTLCRECFKRRNNL